MEKLINKKKYFLIVYFLGYIFLNTAAYSNYQEVKKTSKEVRETLAKEYHIAEHTEKEIVLQKASDKLHHLLTKKLMPPWYGTKWAFYGVSETPGNGDIACGYFVTTLLRDVGFNIRKNYLAQQASEKMIKSLMTEDSIKRFSNVKFDVFLKTIKHWGDGIYIVGLDFHVGFLSVEKDNVYFIHSSYQSPRAVIKEIAHQSKILKLSKYRVLGKLNNKHSIERWLNKERM